MKKQAIIERILGKAQGLAKTPLTDRQLNMLKNFIASRLDTHGPRGYLFKMEAGYHKEFMSYDQVNIIAAYVLDCNHIKR